jgi:5-methyltetrahydrofolate--homocysteine methyltransferase
VEDYATRKGWTLEEAEKWLGPNLHDWVVLKAV